MKQRHGIGRSPRQRAAHTAGLLCAGTLALGCGAPRAVPSLPPVAEVPSAVTPVPRPGSCAAWPLEAGCVQSLATGPEMVCAVTPAAVVCWGPGAAAASATHEPVAVLSRERALELGVRPSAGLRSDAPHALGEFACLPVDEPGVSLRCGRIERPGDGGELGASTPLAIPLEDVAKVALGTLHACLLVRGEVLCVGDPRFAGGEGSSAHTLTRPALSRASDLAALETTTCALTSGDVWCWGGGRYLRAQVPVRVIPPSAAEASDPAPGGAPR